VVAPAIGLQAFPELSQLSHWKRKLSEGLSVHAPFASVSVWPGWAIPEIAGGDVLVGAGGVTTAVGAEVAVLLPVVSVAVSTTTIVCPTSAAVRV
jgi:hypothetical protein